MHSKKTAFGKSFSSAVKRLFHTRNLIIISDHKVDHVPLSGTMQVLVLVGVLGFFSGVSYITGSYMSARNSIKEKDQTIVISAIEKTRISGEMDALKHDLMKLSENGKYLSEYSKFVMEEYPDTDSSHDGHFTISPSSLSAENLFGLNNQKLTDRISYLEQRMNELRDENDHLVVAIRERTDNKIAYFQDIIAMTGLDSDTLEHTAATGEKKTDNASNTPTPAPAAVDSEDDDNAADAKDDNAAAPAPAPAAPKKDAVRPHSENQGGPFIPLDTTSLNDSDREILQNVDRLVLLHDIVEQLPVNQPIADAQQMSPFGKRVDPINGRWAFHPGLDLAGPAGAHIVSASAGTVVYAGRRIGYGNMVDIDHGFGIVSRYAHMSKILVHEGDQVSKGQQIGVQGSTGRATGPHLHFEVRINDRPVNPLKFLHAGEYVLEN